MARVLIIDDERDARLVLRTFLEGDGYELSESDGTDVLSKLGHPIPDVVLLDLKMPEISGWGVLAELKAHPVLTHIPVIMVSGKSAARDAEAAEAFGVTHFITKPFSQETVRAAVTASLGKKPEDSSSGRSYHVTWSDHHGRDFTVRFQSWAKAQALAWSLRADSEMARGVKIKIEAPQPA